MGGIQNDINKMRMAMSALPTSREKEALPHLKVLNTLIESMTDNLNYELNKLIFKDDKLKELLVKNLFIYVSKEIIKTRVYNDKEIIRVADMIFMKLVKWSTKLIEKEDIMIIELLNSIININAEYYQKNGLESCHLFPVGIKLEPSNNHKNWIDNLNINTKVDFLYSCSNKKSWTPGFIVDKDWNSFKIRCAFDENNNNYITNKYFEILPSGTKKDEYNWRFNLKVGDYVDYYDYRSFGNAY